MSPGNSSMLTRSRARVLTDAGRIVLRRLTTEEEHLSPPRSFREPRRARRVQWRQRQEPLQGDRPCATAACFWVVRGVPAVSARRELGPEAGQHPVEDAGAAADLRAARSRLAAALQRPASSLNMPSKRSFLMAAVVVLALMLQLSMVRRLDKLRWHFSPLSHWTCWSRLIEPCCKCTVLH